MKGSLVVVAVGLAAVSIAHLLARAGPPRDANIGAGLLGIAGVGVTAVGAICCVIAVIVVLLQRHRR